MIIAVTFDFWETLVRDTPANLRAQRALRIEALARALGRAGRALSADEVAEAYDRSERLLKEGFWDRHRDPGSREQVRLVLECAVPGATREMPCEVFEEAVEGYISPVLEFQPDLQPGAADTIRALSQSGLALGIISNTGRTPGVMLRRILEAHDLLRHFRAISYSDEVGYRKPDPEIFLRTLAQAEVTPGQAAHVGDNALDDVTGARSVGMRAIHYVTGRGAAASHADLALSDLSELPALVRRL